MATPLEEGKNYLFYPKGSFTGGKVTGFTNAEICLLCTKTYMFVVPIKDFSSILIATRQRSYSYFGEGVPPAQGMEEMLSEDGLTLEDLETRMCEMLDPENHDRVIKMSELSKAKFVLFGPLSQARLKHSKGGAVKVIVPRGKKGAMKELKAFYS